MIVFGMQGFSFSRETFNNVNSPAEVWKVPSWNNYTRLCKVMKSWWNLQHKWSRCRAKYVQGLRWTYLLLQQGSHIHDIWCWTRQHSLEAEKKWKLTRAGLTFLQAPISWTRKPWFIFASNSSPALWTFPEWFLWIACFPFHFFLFFWPTQEHENYVLKILSKYICWGSPTHFLPTEQTAQQLSEQIL